MFVIPAAESKKLLTARNEEWGLVFWTLYLDLTSLLMPPDMAYIIPYRWSDYIRSYSRDTVIMLEFNGIDFPLASRYVEEDGEGGMVVDYNFPEARSDYTKLIPRRSNRVRSTDQDY